MKTKLLIAMMCAWMALPHNQSASELIYLEAPCKKCGGALAYSKGDTESECQTCHEKYALVLLMIGGVLCVIAGGCYTAKKLKKMNSATNGVFNVTNRFRGELTQALFDYSISGMSVVRGGGTNDVPWLLSLNTATNGAGRYVLEQSTDMVTWTELGRYADEDFIAVNEAPAGAAFYRVRVND